MSTVGIIFVSPTTTVIILASISTNSKYILIKSKAGFLSLIKNLTYQNHHCPLYNKNLHPKSIQNGRATCAPIYLHGQCPNANTNHTAYDDDCSLVHAG